jgi:hypothetical protein
MILKKALTKAIRGSLLARACLATTSGLRLLIMELWHLACLQRIASLQKILYIPWAEAKKRSPSLPLCTLKHTVTLLQANKEHVIMTGTSTP